MFRRVILEAPEVFVANLAGDSVVETLVGRKPIETCRRVSEQNEYFEKNTHIPSAFSESVSITNI